MHEKHSGGVVKKTLWTFSEPTGLGVNRVPASLEKTVRVIESCHGAELSVNESVDILMKL